MPAWRQLVVRHGLSAPAGARLAPLRRQRRLVGVLLQAHARAVHRSRRHNVMPKSTVKGPQCSATEYGTVKQCTAIKYVAEVTRPSRPQCAATRTTLLLVDAAHCTHSAPCTAQSTAYLQSCCANFTLHIRAVHGVALNHTGGVHMPMSACIYPHVHTIDNSTQ